AAYDDLKGRLEFGHHLADRGTDQADLFSQFAPVGLAVALVQHHDFAPRRRQITGQRAEQRCFARAIRPEHGPVLSALDAPRNALEDCRLAAPDVQTADFEDGVVLPRHAANIFVISTKQAKQMNAPAGFASVRTPDVVEKRVRPANSTDPAVLFVSFAPGSLRPPNVAARLMGATRPGTRGPTFPACAAGRICH